ncbi:unnamed protein product [Candidatus Paraburkholderia kirkii UZHbot1]|uniref:WGS project CAFE00000000 data, contig bkir_c182 n=1 Tax=Candidatus Paraburkholderia kirkii UZHbot1 TaxID=1055526 RepID=U3UAM0_9BURK|nr:unnamed protein product [Candidatus Paraburkholderia kirkii UZHbot1]
MLGEDVIMQALDIARFTGESPIRARLTHGPVRVVNLMTHRGTARASIDVWRAPGSHTIDAGTVLLHCAQGLLDVRVDQAHFTLTKTDTLYIDATYGIEAELQGDDVLLCASLDTEEQS